MRQHAIATPRVRVHRRRRHAMPRLVRYIEDRFLALPIGAAIALVWANTAAQTFFGTAQTMRVVVNEIAMAFFFGLIMQEILEATMHGGALHSWRRWSLALVGAAGGGVGASGDRKSTGLH